MISFIVFILIGVGFAGGAVFLGKLANDHQAKAESGDSTWSEAKRKYHSDWARGMRLARIASFAVSLLIIFFAVLGTSIVWVPQGKIGTMNRIYFGQALPPGRIVALDGELGPQARILTPGFKAEFLLNILHDVKFVDILSVPPNHCALMSAKDGVPISGGQAFAAPWSDAEQIKMANDATYFLSEGKGQRGPQTSVLTPAFYTINPFLWETPKIIPATRIEQGTVGVVKSSVAARVDFGPFKRDMPESNDLKVMTKLPAGRAKALIVPVGSIGVWEEPLPNGQYYINTDAYRITHVPTIAQVYEYKGGYTRRTVDVSVDDKGKIVEKMAEVEVQAVPDLADTAIFAKPEGWDVAQELRVMAQIDPSLAPFVAAALGLTGDNTSNVIEDRVVTPIIRSVVRDVLGGAQIPFKQQKAVTGPDGDPIVEDDTGEPKTRLVHEFRAVKVMDLLENRPSLEEAMEQRASAEASKEGITIMEILLSESAIPAELLIARKREQLAQQLTKAWKQEEIAQTQRQAVENSRAQAEQQTELVKAEIQAKAAESRAEARKTEAEGEKAYLTAIADGQRAQAAVLGEETTAKLQMFQISVKAFTEVVDKNPDIVTAAFANAKKFVPDVVVGQGGFGLEGAAAIFGHLSNKKADDIAPENISATQLSVSK